MTYGGNSAESLDSMPPALAQSFAHAAQVARSSISARVRRNSASAVRLSLADFLGGAVSSRRHSRMTREHFLGRSCFSHSPISKSVLDNTRTLHRASRRGSVVQPVIIPQAGSLRGPSHVVADHLAAGAA
jgi:hypothetical protein